MMAPCVPASYVLLYMHPHPTPFLGLVLFRLQSTPKDKGTNTVDNHNEIHPNGATVSMPQGDRGI